MTKNVTKLPPGTYLLDCSPLAGPKLLKVNPATLTPEQRMDICSGIQTFALHEKMALKTLPSGEIQFHSTDASPVEEKKVPKKQKGKDRKPKG